MLRTILPRQLLHLTAKYVFEDPGDLRNSGPPGGLPGKYKVTFILMRPGFNPVPEGHYSWASQLIGDSNLAVPQKAASTSGDNEPLRVKIEVSGDGSGLTFLGLPNEKGFLGKIESEPFDASDHRDAKRKAYQLLAPVLSKWSVSMEVPVVVYEIESIELGTGNLQMSVLASNWTMPLSAITGPVGIEFRGYASLYREALNGDSPIYKYLCLFKIIEAIYSRRSRLGRESRERGRAFRRPVEVVPADREHFIPWLNEIFPISWKWSQRALDSIFLPEASGKKFKYIVDETLYQVRHAIAHALTSNSGELTLSADDMLHLEKVHHLLPLTTCIARRMLKNEFPEEFPSIL